MIILFPWGCQCGFGWPTWLSSMLKLGSIFETCLYSDQVLLLTFLVGCMQPMWVRSSAWPHPICRRNSTRPHMLIRRRCIHGITMDHALTSWLLVWTFTLHVAEQVNTPPPFFYFCVPPYCSLPTCCSHAISHAMFWGVVIDYLCMSKMHK